MPGLDSEVAEGDDIDGPAPLEGFDGDGQLDARGWGLGGSIKFVRVPSGGNFILWLSQASQVPSFDSTCSSTYSCRIGNNVVINEDRWRYGSQPEHGPQRLPGHGGEPRDRALAGVRS